MIFPSCLPRFLQLEYQTTNQPLASNNITGSSAVAGGEGNLLQDQDGLATATGTLPEGGGGGGGGADGSATAGTAQPMTMSERARLARIPQPEPGLKCPRCDSTNTKFCYFNNYSLSQPRHFCRACRRYWTQGGALRDVPVGGGYRRHAKRAKPKATASATAATSASAVSSTAPSTCTTVAPTLQAMLGNNASSVLPPLYRFTDFDTASLGLSFPGAAKLFVDTADAHAAGGGSSVQGMEQQYMWRAQAHMQSFPFLHAMDHQMGPATAMPATMAMQGMFHLGLESGGGGGSGVNSEDGGEFHVMPTKREEYPRGMHGDVSGYTSYSSSTAGAGIRQSGRIFDSMTGTGTDEEMAKKRPNKLMACSENIVLLWGGEGDKEAAKTCEFCSHCRFQE